MEIISKGCIWSIGQALNLFKGSKDLTILGFDLGCIDSGGREREQKTKHVFRITALGTRYIIFYTFRNIVESKTTQSARAYGLRLGHTWYSRRYPVMTWRISTLIAL